jgi:N-acetylneuraminic acid mutarotase
MDGRIYAIGGNGAAPSAEVDAYDPCTDTWTTVAPLPAPTYALAAATGPDGRIYAIGGMNGSNATSAVYAYDVAHGTWSAVASLNAPRAYHGAAVGSDGRIYVTGGQSSGSCSTLASTERYDVHANTWTTVGSMFTPRTNLAVVTSQLGMVYAIGGEDCSCNNFTTVEVLDPTSATWSPTIPMPTAQSLGGAALGPGLAPNRHLYLIGGESGPNGCQSGATSLVQDFAGALWTTPVPLPTARRSLAVATGPGPNGFVYAIGGYAPPNVLSVVEAYDTKNNVW